MMKAGFEVTCFEDGEMGREIWDTEGNTFFSLVSPEGANLQLTSLLFSSIRCYPS